jgi:uncharacterized Fe-S center protein
MSRVHLLPANGGQEQTAARLPALWEAAGLADCFREKDLAAIKLHVGEPGTKTYVRPAFASRAVELVAAGGARPFLTDSTVLYKSPRNSAIGLMEVARDHGFGPEATGAPFLACDGLAGNDEVEVEVPGRHFDHVLVASAIAHARSMLVLTHATGHLGTGFGGALKNLGMGCCSRKAKLRQHHGQHPRIDPDACTGCGTCAEWCPEGSIAVGETAEIDDATCIGCGECITACVDGAVDFDWGIIGAELQERIVEHALGVVAGKRDRVAYVTVAMDITKDCDCLGVSQEGVVGDIGVLASRDPVAIDQAVLDLVRERAGKSLEELSYPGRDGSLQITYAQSLGLGESRVELVTVDD